jgi:hypothetical protein
MEPKERAIQLLEERKQRFRDFARLQPDHPFTLANKHMLEASPQTSWDATGTIEMTGVLWWALSFGAALAPPNTVIFNAHGGPSASIAIFTSVLTGAFHVDPSTLGGKCQFTLQAVAGGVGEVSLYLYDMNWTETGGFFGAVGGLSATYISSTGTITYY